MNKRLARAGIGVAVFCVGMLLIALLWSAPHSAPRVPTPEAACQNNLKQLGLALHNYHDDYDSFPPAYVADGNGRRMHSWRVLLLPYVDEQALYDAYDFSQPWDSPANRVVLENMPDVYRCSVAEGSPMVTSYAAVFGPDCVFSGVEGLHLPEVTDGLSYTLAVGEADNAGIPWTKPQDVDVNVHPRLNDPHGFSSDHEGGMHFLFADGSVHFIAEDIPQQTLQNLFRRNDGNRVQPF